MVLCAPKQYNPYYKSKKSIDKNFLRGDLKVAIFDSVDFDNHEQVVYCSDDATGLKAIIAVHSTALGPAAGGCRFWDYANDEEALTDVLRLSKGMTYKNAMAGLKLGGGKGVIIGNPKELKSNDLFKAYGKAVNNLAKILSVLFNYTNPAPSETNGKQAKT